LSTAGGLVFQGTADARFAAYDAASGAELWTFPTQTGVLAGPVSYEIDGEQYVAVAVGWGGAYALGYGGVAPTGSEPKVGRVLAFKLGGTATLPALADDAAEIRRPPAATAPADDVRAGLQAYAENCMVCHGDHAVSYGIVPNLRRSPALGDAAAWKAIVREGGRAELGMPNFGATLDDETAEAIRAYVIAEANSGRDERYYRRVSPP
jgi:quinohemoprotein ethanol dehydrogenase